MENVIDRVASYAMDILKERCQTSMKASSTNSSAPVDKKDSSESMRAQWRREFETSMLYALEADRYADMSSPEGKPSGGTANSLSTTDGVKLSSSPSSSDDLHSLIEKSLGIQHYERPPQLLVDFEDAESDLFDQMGELRFEQAPGKFRCHSWHPSRFQRSQLAQALQPASAPHSRATTPTNNSSHAGKEFGFKTSALASPAAAAAPAIALPSTTPTTTSSSKPPTLSFNIFRGMRSHRAPSSPSTVDAMVHEKDHRNTTSRPPSSRSLSRWFSFT